MTTHSSYSAKDAEKYPSPSNIIDMNVLYYFGKTKHIKHCGFLNVKVANYFMQICIVIIYVISKIL